MTETTNPNQEPASQIETPPDAMAPKLATFDQWITQKRSELEVVRAEIVVIKAELHSSDLDYYTARRFVERWGHLVDMANYIAFCTGENI